MKPLRPTMSVLFSITLSIGFIVSVGLSQQQAPKPNERTGGVQAPGKRPSPVIPGQSKEKKAPKDEDDAIPKAGNNPNIAELRQRGIDLTQQVGEEASGLDDRRSAAIIQAVAADVLWPHRKEPARDLFRKAFEIAATYYKETLDNNQRQLSKNKWTSLRDVRVEVIKLINKRDPEMGAEYNDKFIESKSREEQERAARAAPGQGQGPGKSNYFGSNDVATDGLMEMAKTLLNEDAKIAVDIARRAVDLGISPAFVVFLFDLSRRDRAVADELYLHALQRLSVAQTPLPGQLLALSVYPFGGGQFNINDSSNSAGWDFGKLENFDVNSQHVQKFLTVALNALQRLANPSVMQAPDATSRLSVALYAAKALESKVAAFHPALRDQWQGMTSSLVALNPDGPAQRIHQSLQSDAEWKEARPGDGPRQQSTSRQKGEVEELLERSQKTNDFAYRDSLYSQAAFAAESAGDISRAMEIAGRISDLTLRGKMKSWINYNATEKAIGEKRFDDARQYALGVDETDYRAYLFFQIAEKVFSNNDRDRGRELLEEAARRAVEAEDTQEKIKVLCAIADLYLKIDQDRSFSLAEAAVRAANKIPADKLNLVEGGSRMIRTLSYPSGTRSSILDVGGFDVRKVFSRLAGYDFDLSLALTRAIENNSVRCWAMIAVAESAFVKR